MSLAVLLRKFNQNLPLNLTTENQNYYPVASLSPLKSIVAFNDSNNDLKLFSIHSTSEPNGELIQGFTVSNITSFSWSLLKLESDQFQTFLMTISTEKDEICIHRFLKDFFINEEEIYSESINYKNTNEKYALFKFSNPNDVEINLESYTINLSKLSEIIKNDFGFECTNLNF